MSVNVEDIINEQGARADRYATQVTNMQAWMQSALAAWWQDGPDPEATWELKYGDDYQSDLAGEVPESVAGDYVGVDRTGTVLGDLAELGPLDGLVLSEYPLDIDDLFKTSKPEFDAPDPAGPFLEVDWGLIDSLLSGITLPEWNDVDEVILRDYVIPDFPTVDVPTFDVSLVADDPGAAPEVATIYQAKYEELLPEVKSYIDTQVSTWEDQYAPGYRTALAALEAKLADGLERGTALPLELDNAMYNKARQQVETSIQRAVDEIERGNQRRGFDLPPGSLTAARTVAQIESGHALAKSATDIYIERAKMEVQHIQFVLGQSASIRQWMIQASIQYAGFVLQTAQFANDQAKTFATFLLEQYNANLRRYTAQLEVYKTEAAIYETRMKASLAQLEIYKLELEGVKLNVEVDKLRVDVYSEKIRAEIAKIQAAAAQLDFVAKRADIEITKLKANSEDVARYIAELQAEEMKFKVYSAAISGDRALLEARVAEMEAIIKRDEMEGKKLELDLKHEAFKVEYNRMLMDKYKVELDALAAEDRVKMDEYKSKLELQLANIDLYKSLKGIEIQELTNELEKDKLTLSYEVQNAQIKQTNIARDMQYTNRLHEVQAQLHQQMANMYSNMSASALASQNTMVSSVESASVSG